MHIYESHMGGLYACNDIIDDEYLYCEECGDYDEYIGEANTREEAYKVLEPHTDRFDWSMCENCPYDTGDEDCTDSECENLSSYGRFSPEYIREFIEDNWKK